MLLVVDIGNTNIVFGLFNGERLKDNFRMASRHNLTSDEIGFFVGFIFGLTSHALALELAAIFAAIQEVALAFAGQALVVAVAISAT